MKPAKSLEKLAATVDGTIHEICYRMQGKFLYGWVIVDGDNNELLECEPVYYSNGDKWIIRKKERFNNSHFYARSLRDIDKKVTIKAGYTGIKFGRTSQLSNSND